MRTLAVSILLLLMASTSQADPTPTPTPEPTATPTPTASPYSSFPVTVTETSIIQTSPIMVLPQAIGRDRVTVEVVAGLGVQCSQTDSEVRTDVFRVFESPTPPYQVVDPQSPLYCKSKDGAVLQLVIDKNPDTAYTKIVKNIGVTSIRVLKRNPRRTRASIIVNNYNGSIYCGYTCPASESAGMLMSSMTPTIFRGGGDICCAKGSTGEPSDISVTAEFSTMR